MSGYTALGLVTLAALVMLIAVLMIRPNGLFAGHARRAEGVTDAPATVRAAPRPTLAAATWLLDPRRGWR